MSSPSTVRRLVLNARSCTSVTFLLVALATADGAHAEDNPPIPERPGLFKALDGEWVMTGDVMGEPVTYRMNAGPTLSGAFTEMHMIDVAIPPGYEARVFLGYDQDTRTVIVHWLDSFGGKYSIPHGTGTLTDDSIQFVVPYPSGAFRDTFKYDPHESTWLFVIEAQQPDGSWQYFARYSVHRP